MSTSQFNPTASLGLGAGIRGRASLSPGETLLVSGTIEIEKNAGDQRQVHVFVVIEQETDPPADPDGPRQPRAVATGYVLEEGSADSLEAWSAKMTVQPGPNLKPGMATGAALTVEFSENPIGFETYAWTDRINLKE